MKTRVCGSLPADAHLSLIDAICLRDVGKAAEILADHIEMSKIHAVILDCEKIRGDRIGKSWFATGRPAYVMKHTPLEQWSFLGRSGIRFSLEDAGVNYWICFYLSLPTGIALRLDLEAIFYDRPDNRGSNLNRWGFPIFMREKS